MSDTAHLVSTLRNKLGVVRGLVDKGEEDLARIENNKATTIAKKLPPSAQRKHIMISLGDLSQEIAAGMNSRGIIENIFRVIERELSAIGVAASQTVKDVVNLPSGVVKAAGKGIASKMFGSPLAIAGSIVGSLVFAGVAYVVVRKAIA